MSDLHVVLDRFTYSNRTGFDDQEVFKKFLSQLLISDVDYAQNFQKLAGFVHIPLGGDKARCVNVNDVSKRAAIGYQLNSYLDSNNAKYDQFEYLKIEYTGQIDEEWQQFDNTLMDFIDYIVPFISDSKDNDICINDIIFADHCFEKNKNQSFHILYKSNIKHGLYGLWQRYLEVIEEQHPEMLNYRKWEE